MEEGGEDDIIARLDTVKPEVPTDAVPVNTTNHEMSSTQNGLPETSPALQVIASRGNRKAAPKNKMVFEEWHCPKCDKFNYIGRSMCKRCNADAPPSVALKRKKEAPTPMDEVEAIIATTLLEITGMDDGHHRADLFQMNMMKGDGDGAELEKDFIVHEGEVERGSSAEKTVEQFMKDEDEARILEDEKKKKEMEEKRQQEEEAAIALKHEQEMQQLARMEEETFGKKDDEDKLTNADISKYANLNTSFQSSLMVPIKWKDDLEPGNILICDIQCSSFEIRWEPPIQDREYDSYRVSILDQYRQVLDIINTNKKSWYVYGLDPGCKYHIAVTCRAMVTTHVSLPDEREEEFFLPTTTIKTTVRTRKQKSELAYWFDNQVNSPFHYRPFKLYLGTVSHEDGSFKQETKLGIVEMAVRFGMLGTSEQPAAAKVGYTCFELFSPYSLGIGAYVEFEVEQAHRSVYEIELWVKQHNPIESDYEIAPSHVKELANQLEESETKVRSLLLLEQDNNQSDAQANVDQLMLELDKPKTTDESITAPHKALDVDSVVSIGESSPSLSPTALFNDSSLVQGNQSLESTEPSLHNDHENPNPLRLVVDENDPLASSVWSAESSEEKLGEIGESSLRSSISGGMLEKRIQSKQDEGEDADPLSLAVRELASNRRTYLSGGTYLHVRDRVDGSYVNSEPATKVGEWEKLTVRTAFKSNKMKFHVQVPAKFFGSVLIDNFKVSYMGPSQLEIKIKESLQWLEWGKGARTQALQVNAICVEDLITASGSRINGPVLAKFYWNGEFLEQTDVALGGIDPQFHNTFRVPLLVKKRHLEAQSVAPIVGGGEENRPTRRGTRKKNGRFGKKTADTAKSSSTNHARRGSIFGNKPIELGMRVEVVDAMSNSVIGKILFTESELLSLPPAPCVYTITKKHRKAKGCCAKSLNCVCGCICSIVNRKKSEKKNKEDSKGLKNKSNIRKVVPDNSESNHLGENDDFSEDTMAVSEQSSVFEDDSMSQLENGLYKRHDDEEFIYAPRGRVVLSVSRLIDLIPEMTDEDRLLVNLRNGLIRKEKKTLRQLIREVEKERKDVDDLDFKCKLIRFGVIDIAVTLLSEHVLGPLVAEMLILFTKVSDEVTETQGGHVVRRLLRYRLHKLGVAKAVFMSSRTRVRKNRYNALNRFHFSIPPELLKLLCEVYISNRMLLLEVILNQIDIFEMLIRCIPDPYEESKKAKKNKATPKMKEAGQLAGRLLEEVGLGKTMPDEIMFEYFRLRRIIPLDEKFWTCEQLYSLPMTIPKRIIHIYENDRLECLPPDQPDMTPWETFIHSMKQCLLCLVVVIIIGTIVMSFFSLLRNGISCSLTLSAMVLGLVSCCSVIYMKMIARMIKIGVGTQIAIICCPFVSCNACCLVAAAVWAFMLLFISTDGLDQCQVSFLNITRLLLACIGLAFARVIIQYLIIQGSRMWKFVMLHCCCCVSAFHARSRPSSPIREADLKDFL